MAELVPEGAWDTHTHIFDPDNFPYGAKRSYTPKAAQLSEYPADVTGCKKIVVVHASVQGSSPAALVDTLSKQNRNEFKGLTLRGLATIDPADNISDTQLDELHAVGVRGARFHRMAWGHGAQSSGADIIDEITTVAERSARLGWIIDVFCPIEAWAHMAETVRSLNPRVRMVADHFGGAFPGDEKSESFQIFLQLVREKKLFVKFSGFERLYHGHAEGMEALRPIANAILEAGPDQVIFATDWPHTQLGVARKGKTDEQRLTDIEGFRDVPDAEHIRTLRTWIPEDDIWEKLFVKNADRLFE